MRDKVERGASWATIFVFVVSCLFVIGAELLPGTYRPSELVYLVVGHLLSEMKALTVGRGEDATFSGDPLHPAAHNGEPPKEG